jgi:hypothetical protein
MHTLLQERGERLKELYTKQRDNYFVPVLNSRNITNEKSRYITPYNEQATG